MKRVDQDDVVALTPDSYLRQTRVDVESLGAEVDAEAVIEVGRTVVDQPMRRGQDRAVEAIVQVPRRRRAQLQVPAQTMPGRQMADDLHFGQGRRFCHLKVPAWHR